MGLLVRLLLALSGTMAAVFVARDAPNFGVVQGMLALVLVLAAVALFSLSRHR